MTIKFTKTSESVSSGHPDKIADQIADTIFDYLRTFKKDAQSAVEVTCGAHKILICGEIDKDIVGANTTGETRVEKINKDLTMSIVKLVHKTIEEIGYPEEYYDPEIIIDLVTQSEEINEAVEENEQHVAAAGDQGFVTGFATKETTQYHELHYWLANRIIVELEKLRKDNKIEWLYPDAKSQVTIEYEKDNNIVSPTKITHVLLSQCHHKDIPIDIVRATLKNEVIIILNNILQENKHLLVNYDRIISSIDEAIILINPAGSWSKGGAAADSGLTGRKLVVDNYGSAAPIGGGSQSGKNANKVDRSGACYARNIAKNIVNQKLADRVLVEIGFAIGVPHATSWNIETYGTEKETIETIEKWVKENYDFTVSSMINLCDSIDKYSETSKNGFYTNNNFPWEKLI